MEETKPKNVASTQVVCNHCDNVKLSTEMVKGINICRDCNNFRRREKYKNNEEFRKKTIQQASDFKHNKVIQRQKVREEEQEKIGIDNKKCKYCDIIKHNSRFRHNRLKCRDCERDEPVDKFKRYVRTRIYNCLRNKNKTKHSVEYLGCTSEEYLNWMLTHNPDYNLDNYGKIWHIDHVIPLSKFDLDNEDQQLIAFNWRNTMPLSSTENLAKNNRICGKQVALHVTKLKQFHLKNNLTMPQKFIDLFAKHLDAGNPLEPFTTTSSMET